jgi:hypothetical protein
MSSLVLHPCRCALPLPAGSAAAGATSPPCSPSLSSPPPHRLPTAFPSFRAWRTGRAWTRRTRARRTGRAWTRRDTPSRPRPTTSSAHRSRRPPPWQSGATPSPPRGSAMTRAAPGPAPRLSCSGTCLSSTGRYRAWASSSSLLVINRWPRHTTFYSTLVDSFLLHRSVKLYEEFR